MRPRLPNFRRAILHQGAAAPAVGGVIKPFKPGGYTDSGSDLANILYTQGENLISSSEKPSPTDDKSWTFPDTVAGIRAALDKGANVFWANTTLHARHSLVQMRDELAEKGVRMIGQSPIKTEEMDDKAATNKWLKPQPALEGSFPKATLVDQGSTSENIQKVWDELSAEARAVVAKPIRGRGSHGVTVVNDIEESNTAIKRLLSELSSILVEEYCGDEEITVTVLPPGEYFGQGIKERHWSLPVIRRVGHKGGVAPYSGLVAVTVNSHPVTPQEHASDKAYTNVQAKCAQIGALLGTYGIIRVDCRRRKGDQGEFVLFDINSKPNMTGPGRPGREEQTALTGMAAQEIGWDYPEFVLNELKQAKLVDEVIPEEKY